MLDRDQLRRNLTQTVIGRPLLDFISDPVNINQPYDVIIDPNLDFAGGRELAAEQIKKLIQTAAQSVGRPTDPDPAIRYSADHPYIFATLPARVIIELARLDATEQTAEPVVNAPGHQRLSGPKRAIHRIWLDPEIQAQITNSIATVKADAAHAAFTATGDDIVWAVVDSGIQGDHPHLAANVRNLPPPIDHFDFVTNTKSALIDDYGHGSHVAGIIAGSMDIATEPKAVIRVRNNDTDEVLSTITSLKKTVRGMAPNAKLVNLRVLGPSGKGKTSSVIEALAYIQRINDFGRRVVIHGVNLSVGYPFMPEWFACGQSPLCVEVNRMVRSGVVVVVAAGNSGYGTIAPKDGSIFSAGIPLTINDPGNAEFAITVGSTHRDMPHLYGVSYFSSKGPTGDGRPKPDLVAPGERILSCAAGATKDKAKAGLSATDTTQDFHYVEDSGTSMAAPHVSGVIASFLSIRREFIGRPDDVKQLFMQNAVDLNRDRSFQGCGLVDLIRTIQAV